MLSLDHGGQCDGSGDRDVLEQVLVNLIDNAARYAPEGGEVVVALARRDEVVDMTVADQGPGIPEQQLERIFERCYSDRDETVDSDGNEHFGIGLWIVRRNVESIGGRITAENRPQGGFRVRLRIPSV